VIIADGFSCKEQIEQTTDRNALHLAQVLQMALHEGIHGPKGDYPERGYLHLDGEDSGAVLNGKLLGMAAGAALAGGALYWALNRSNKQSGKLPS
jgi:hypothetical protein